VNGPAGPELEHLLTGLPDLAFGFMIVLCRISAAVMVLPGFGETEIPAVVRAGLAVGITLLIFPGVESMLPGSGGAVLRDLAIIGSELGFGLLLGWLARLMALSLPIAGQVISTIIGLSSVLQPDPELGSQTTGVSRVLALAVPVLVLSSGLYALPLGALAGSYRLVPPGTLFSPGDAAQSVAVATEGCFSLALRLAAPLVLAGFVWQVMLGLLARLVPSLQVYSLSLPGQVLGGLLLLALLIGPLLAVWMQAMASGFATLPGL
jgi:flagellar biosynthesis protein FliR